MSFYVHFSSGHSGLWSSGMSLREEAERHATDLHGSMVGQAGEVWGAREIERVWQIHEYLEDIQRDGSQISFMDFHVHGGPGQIAIGSEAIFDWRREFGDRGYESLFASDASIEFHGCGVAAEGDGEAFLADCAWTFLRTNGGTARASTFYELALPGGSTPFAPGSVVVAHISAGGHVQLRGGTHLLPTRLRHRLDRLRERFARLTQGRHGSLDDSVAVNGRLLDGAQDLLAGRPSYRDLNGALVKLNSVDRSIPIPWLPPIL